MFGKRAKNQNQDQDFEGSEAEFTEDFAAQDQMDEESGWGDDPTDGDDAVEPELRDRRRSPLVKILPFAAIGVLAAGGVGYYYLNFMQAPAPATPVIAAAPSDPAVMAEPTATAAAPTDVLAANEAPVFADPTTSEATAETAVPAVPSGMFEPAGDPLAEVEVPETVAAAPTDIQLETPVTDSAPDLVIEPAPADTIAVIKPAPVVPDVAPAAPEAVVTAAPPAPVPAPVTVTTPAPAAVTTSPAPAGADDNIADISGRMDVLEHQIEDLTKAVDRLATANTAAAPAVADTELKNTVAALQDQVRKLQTELTTLRNAPARAPAAAATTTPAAPATRSTTASSDPAPARPTAATSTATRSNPTPRPAAAAPAPAQVRWVLRAAQSSEAWVSRSSEGELRSVTVGQSLEGIGRVTAIRQTGNGAWEVIGTQGTLRQ